MKKVIIYTDTETLLQYEVRPWLIPAVTNELIIPNEKIGGRRVLVNKVKDRGHTVYAKVHFK